VRLKRRALKKIAPLKGGLLTETCLNSSREEYLLKRESIQSRLKVGRVFEHIDGLPASVLTNLKR